MKESIVKSKSYEFSLQIIHFYKCLLDDHEYIISKQLLKSGTSIGATIEEALAGQSRKDFTAKMSIASKEARETRYWLRLLKDSELTEHSVEDLLISIEELVKILTAIVKTSQQKIR